MKIIYLLFYLAISLNICGDTLTTNIISSDRTNNWTPGVYTGVYGGIPTGLTVYTNMMNIDATGASDVSSAIQTAYNNCPSNQIIAFPAGIFTISNTITVASGRVIRGAGMTNTIFRQAPGSSGFQKDNAVNPAILQLDYPYSQPITQPALRGATNLFFTNTSDFSAGSLAYIGAWSSTNQYDNPLIMTVGGTSAIVHRVISRVVAVTSSNITIWPPLVANMTNNGSRISVINSPISRAGFEDFTVDIVQSNSTRQAFYLYGFKDSWMKNIRVKHAFNYSVDLYQAVGFQMQSCWLDDLDNGGGSNGAGLLYNTVCSSLVEDSIIMNSQPSVEINSGSSGNVFAYNFFFNTNGVFEIDSNHGAHNDFNLFEGNVAGRFIADGFFGSVSEDTIYRNWFHAQQTGSTSLGYTIALKRFTRKYSVVGNILGSGSPKTMNEGDGITIHLGEPDIGNNSDNGTNAPPWPDWMGLIGTNQSASGYRERDTNVANTLVQFGNFNYASNAIPASQNIGTNILVSSLYLISQPSWWGSFSNAWPPINPSTGTSRPLNDLTNDVMIPAQATWLGLSFGADTNAPILNTATISIDGTTWTFSFNEAITFGSGGNTGWTTSISGGIVTLTYSSGSGTSSLIYTGNRTVLQGETGTVSYTQPGNGIEDNAGNDFASVSGVSAVNNSTQILISLRYSGPIRRRAR